MRDIWLCDAEGRLDESVEPVGLSSEIWRQLFPMLSQDPTRPLLSKLWQYHWGAEGDAFLSPELVRQLHEEVVSWRENFSGAEDEAIRAFFEKLAHQLAIATENQASIRFIAD